MFDRHILRGQSMLDLRSRLEVRDEDDNEWKSFDLYRFDNQDVEIEFRPVFAAENRAAEYRGFGIHVIKDTGEISVDGGAFNDQPHNFIVEAVVRRNQGGVAPHRIGRKTVRVHLHNSVERLWVTPETLTVRRPPDPSAAGAQYNPDTRHAFTVRARFDDGTTGDVTYAPELGVWGPDDRYFWLDADTGIQRISIPADSSIGLPIEARISAGPGWGNLTARGWIMVLDPWATQAGLPAIEWIDGHPGVLDGTMRPERLPNVLFLACGYPDVSRGEYAQLTNLVVHRLKTDPLLQPYGYLAGSMNYWRLGLPGQTAGVSVRCEVAPYTRLGHRFADPVPSPDPPSEGERWTLEHLIYMAGLPIPADLALVADETTQQSPATVEELKAIALGDLDFTRLFARWNAMMRPAPARNVARKIVKRWLLLANRTFIDEVDTFPSIALGEPPTASFDDGGPFTFHDLRGGIRECRQFLRLLSAAPRPGRPPIVLGNDVMTVDGALSTALGNLWGRELANSAAFDNRQFLTPLSNVPFGRPQWSRTSGLRIRPYLSGLGLSPASKDTDYPGLPVAPSTVSGGLALVTLSMSLAPPLADNWITFAHELAHAFGLGDEYVEFAEDYPGTEDGLRNDANLTTLDAVTFANGRVSLGLIKWNWHRIIHASVVTRQIQARGNGRFEVAFVPTRAPWFAPRSIVFLRERDPQLTIGRDTVTLGPFEVESVGNAGDTMIVVSQVAGMTAAEVENEVDQMFPAIVFMPVPGLNSGQTLGLVSPAAWRIMQIALEGGTMTGKVCDTAQQAGKGGAFTQVPLKSDPVGRVSAKDLPGLVGLYFGGKQYACGILHPTGQCLMRDSDNAASRFCPVCQYVLIDQIDPNQHWQFDREYRRRYPM
jgi:hypothetical protein